MPLFDDEDKPKKTPVHEIGTDLSMLSVEEIDERIAALEGEIERLRAAKSGKIASRGAAETFFR